MSKYKVSVTPGAGVSPEFAPDQKLQEGIPADGIVILAFMDGKHAATIVHDVTIMEIATAIAGDNAESGSKIRQAIAIAEGLMKAREIDKSDGAKRAAKSIADLLSIGRDL